MLKRKFGQEQDAVNERLKSAAQRRLGSSRGRVGAATPGAGKIGAFKSAAGRGGRGGGLGAATATSNFAASPSAKAQQMKAQLEANQVAQQGAPGLNTAQANLEKAKKAAGK